MTNKMTGQHRSSRPANKGVKHAKNVPRAERRKQNEEDLEKLQEAVDNYDPAAAALKTFSDLPLSFATAAGLNDSHFQVPTDIQKHAVPLALKGRDILGAAKTGSGKTLAFLIPVLEKLHRTRWTEFDGLGALVISPTRELAVQTFEVLRKVGRHHSFSAGLVIGGKNLKDEADRLGRMNILVCTPGRMLQHLDQTAGLDVDNLQMLVLDEADRIMDMGFQVAVDALVEHLPRARQTLMFSATQSKKVSDLARLSLKDPEYVSVHSGSASATPTTLQQHYIVTPLPEKLDTLYGFVKTNLKSKIMVFLSSGKQVRFVYEGFRHMQPGIPLLHLHGRQKQLARLEITSRFASAKYACLFATDVVARGIDFPAVDWVIQVDCPEDADTYIHRAGRTARYESKGRAVLFLDPSEEEGMIRKLQHKKVPIQKVSVKESKKRSIRDQLQSMCFQNPDLKYLGQKAFISYTRSIHLQGDTEVFKFKDLDLDGFAASLGLPGAPQIRYQKGDDVKKIKNAPRALLSSGSEFEDEPDARSRKRKRTEVRTKYDRMFERTNQDVLSSHYTKLIGQDADETKEAKEAQDAEDAKDAKEADDDDDDAEFLSVKRRLGDDELDEAARNAYGQSRVVTINGQPFVVDSKRREKMLTSKKRMLKLAGKPNRIVFDDDGKPRPLYELRDEDDFMQAGPVSEQRQRYVQSETSRVREADADDRALAKQKRKEKREKRKDRDAQARDDMANGPGRRVAVLGGGEAEVEDPPTFLRSLPVAGQDASSSKEAAEEMAAQATEEEREEVEEVGRGGGGEGEGEGGTGRDKKRLKKESGKAKKWFQNESDVDDGRPRKTSKRGLAKSRPIDLDQDVDKLEDLEALATGLLED